MEHLVGTMLGRYRLDKLLGVGGMGAVFKAYDPVLELDVAIKVMHPHLAQGPGARRRFIQEARAAVRLNHPGIVRFFDVGDQNSHLYIVMEFIPGENLRFMINRHRAEGRTIPLDEAVRLVRQVCVALEHAHGQGIMHRDLKPENIMLKPDPTGGLPYLPIVTDLGLARLGQRDITAEGVPMGTLAYMSPEQAQGRETDARSDVYSLGILLFELTVGRQPFPARTITEAIRYHTLEPPPPPRSLRPDLRRVLEDLILQALSKDPRDRPRDAGALGRALDEVLTRMPAQAERAAVAPPPGEEVSLLETYHLSLERPPTPPPLDRFPPPAGVDQPRVAALLPDGSTASAVVGSEGLVIGRAPEAGLVLDDKYISRHHLRVDLDEGRVEVTDLKSKHGTFLGDSRLLPGVPETWTEQRLVCVGRSWLRLESPAPIAPPSGPGLTHGDGTAVQPGEIVSSAGLGRVGLLLDGRDFSVSPGSPVALPLTILNQGTVVDRFHVSVGGVPESWLPGLTASVRLLPGEHQPVPLTILPPQSPEAEAGRHELVVRVASEDNPEEVAQLELALTVGGYSRWRSRLAPQRFLAGKQAKVEVENQGNAPQPLTVRWEDRAEALSFDPPQAELTVPPGESSQASFRAVPRRRRWVGAEKLHPITAEVSAPDGQTQSHTGEVVSRGRIPAWLLPAAGLFVALGVAAALVVPPLLSRETPMPEPTDTGMPTEVVEPTEEAESPTKVVEGPSEVPPSLPDLYIKSADLGYDGTVYEGGCVTDPGTPIYTLCFGNQGRVDCGAFHYRVDQEVLEFQSGLPAGEWICARTGGHPQQASLDPGNLVDESNEGNNEAQFAPAPALTLCVEEPQEEYNCTDAWGCVEVLQGETVRVAYAGPLTGPSSSLGVDISRGCELALQAHPDVLGFPVSLITADTEGSAEVGYNVATELVAEERVVGVVGHTYASSTMAAIPVYEDAGLVMISPTVARTNIEELGPNVFNRVALSDEYLVLFTVDFMIETLGVRSVTFVHDGDAPAEAQVREIADEFESRGGTVVGLLTVGSAVTDPYALNAMLENLVDEGSQLLYYGGYDLSLGVSLVNQMRRSGGAASGLPVFVSSALYGQDYIDGTRAAAEGTYAVSTLLPARRDLVAFKADYEETYGDPYGELSPYSAYGYDAVSVLLACVEEVAVESGATLYVPRQALAQAVRKLSNYGGLTGTLTNDGKGNLATQPPIFVVVQNGQWVVVPGQ